ncbi:Paraquat-inducible protein B [hydrothermal vent metagenome]|uniref:Paraquat-inducible protein B n=1 Tax=hydrothermal vent metagenome TaxID=652676 RepID=A0A1W1EF99_9ZZZZ
MEQNIPDIKESSKFNFITSIWIVPFIALIIAGWLGYQYFASRGQEIKIIFPTNEGLVAGQSVLKFKNVPVGKVTKIYVDKESTDIVVIVRMNSERSTPYLTENAKFWIEKPRVGIGGISGLDTLISGTYINIHSTKGGKIKRRKFIGLTQPYRDTMRGEYFHLITSTGDNVSVGMPIYYKNIKVGQVEYVYLSLDKRAVDVIVFINKQYASLVRNDSRFWIKSMMNIDFAKGNFDVNLAPFNFMLQGGIVFSSGKKGKGKVSKNKIFPIYKSKTHAESMTIGAVPKTLRNFTLNTTMKTSNLREMSPVRFYGYEIGWVDSLDINYNSKIHKMETKIVISIDTSIFKDKNEKNVTGLVNLYKAVDAGMRAKLDALDPISGMMFIDLTFDHKDTDSKGIVNYDDYNEMPMLQTSTSGIMDSIGVIMKKIERLPLDKLVNSLNDVINEASEPIENANEMLIELKKSAKNVSDMTSNKSFKTMPNEMNKAIKELTKTIRTTRKVVNSYGEDSMLNEQLSYTLEILTKTSKEMEVFLRMLNRKPNSLIFGD